MPELTPGLSVNALTATWVDSLIADAAQLKLAVSQLDNGSTVIDAGIRQPGSLEAGRRIAEICLGGLGRVSLAPGSPFDDWPWQVEVATSHPVVACLGSQYAGWSLAASSEKFHALGSGPGRSLARREPLFEELGYADRADRTCLVLETDRYPPAEVVEKICHDCAVPAQNLSLILTPTGSAAGVVQIAARVVEVALHKAHELGFPLASCVEGLGCTPLPPPTADGLKAMGRTNDTILFGGNVQLWVDGDDEAAKRLAEQLPSRTSRDYGKPFAQVFADYEFDFFKIDPLLFSPAKVAVTATRSGQTYHAGSLDAELLNRSFAN